MREANYWTENRSEDPMREDAAAQHCEIISGSQIADDGGGDDNRVINNWFGADTNIRGENERGKRST